MADEKAFSHITVSTDDEDDLVIQAGARVTSRPTPAAGGPARAEAPSASAPVEAAVPATGEPVADGASGAEQGDAREAEVDDAASASGVTGREDELKDLESTPMSPVQKAVLAVALLFVVGFAIYYVVVY